ncbi:hypothetical protein BH10CYA1_BH10CYA1_22820 [soil metagenome]
MNILDFRPQIHAIYSGTRMNQVLYEQYKQFQSRGCRAEAGDAVNKFILSFGSPKEKENFTRWFFENDFRGEKIRHELYSRILFPVLIDGYGKKEPWSMLQLSRTEENIFQVESEQHGNNLQPASQTFRDLAKVSLLREYIKLEPTDSTARVELISAQIDWFRYCEHEWPWGILYGQNGATEAECREILDEVSFVRDLDIEQKYKEYFDPFESRVRIYMEEIVKRKQGSGST